MTRLNKNTKAGNGTNGGRTAAAGMKTASLSARDPLAYAIALKALG